MGQALDDSFRIAYLQVGSSSNESALFVWAGNYFVRCCLFWSCKDMHADIRSGSILHSRA